MVIELGTTNKDPQGNSQGFLAVRNVHDVSLVDDVKAAIADWTPVTFDAVKEPWKVAAASKGGVTLTLTKRYKGGVSYTAFAPTVEKVIEVCAGLPMFPADKAAEIVKVPAAIEADPAAEPA